MRLLAKLTAASIALTPMACDSGSSEPSVEADDMDLFAEAGKTDTGYVSDQAAELEAELVGQIVIDLTARDAAEASRLIAAQQANDLTAFATLPTEQVKFARNVLKEEKFNANIEGGAAEIVSVENAADTTLTVSYKVTVESLVKEKDLLANGQSLSQLVGHTVNMRLPADPTTAFARGGVACAQDPDDPSADVTADIEAFNYFYYWMPDKAGCTLATETATFTVKNSAAAKASYPELDRLLADKKITLVALFGQLEHGELLSGPADDNWDWGWIGYEDFTNWLKSEGYTKKSQLPARAGLGKVSSSKWSKKYSAGMTVEVDVVSPLDLQDHADAAAKDAILASAVKNHEIVYYNGHSFYGSLKVLDVPENFPSTYQIIFMDSCWSYAYYTKQVFTSKATAADPTGMLAADVLNNTEPGISGSHETFAVFLKKLFVAANFVAQKTPGKAKNYTWKNLVGYMNTSAQKRAEEGGHDPEIYGVSGVSTNVWKP